MAPDYVNNKFTYMLFCQYRCTHVVLSLVKVLDCKVVRTLRHRIQKWTYCLVSKQLADSESVAC